MLALSLGFYGAFFLRPLPNNSLGLIMAFFCSLEETGIMKKSVVKFPVLPP
jgi:hypothetical protein